DEERLEAAGDAEHARAGGDEHEPAEPLAVAQGELLRETAAPRDAERVDDAVAEDVERAHEEPRQPAEAPRHERRRRAAGPGDVDGDGLDAVEARAERREELEPGADAVDEEERPPAPAALDRRPQPDALDLDELDLRHASAPPGG